MNLSDLLSEEQLRRLSLCRKAEQTLNDQIKDAVARYLQSEEWIREFELRAKALRAKSRRTTA